MIRFAVAVLFAALNLVPLYGIQHWNWDAFQLLIIYWTETLILAGWAMVRIALLPEDRLGTMTVNGKVKPATRRMMVGFFSLHAGMFIAVHLLFLCLLFSGDWFKRLTGIGDFFHTFYIASGGWVVVLAALVIGGVEALTAEVPVPRAPTAKPTVAAPAFTITSGSGDKEVTSVPAGDAVGAIVGGLYGRIVIMQVAIIFGAWAANSYGSLAPFTIVIVLKTLFDFGSRLGR